MKHLALVLLVFLALVLGAGAVPPWIYLSGNRATPISVPSNWGEVDCTNLPTCHSQSANKVLTVPAGNSGTIQFGTGDPTNFQYSTNNGTSFTTVTNGQTVVFTNGQTMMLKINAISEGTCAQMFTTDNDTESPIGGGTGFTACNTGSGP